MKKLMLITLMVAAGLWTACQGDRTDKTTDGEIDSIENTMNDVEARNDAKFNKDSEDDAEFAAEAQEVNLEEVQLGQLAQSRATAAAVKELATMLVNHHQKAADQLAALAEQKRISVPSAMTDDIKRRHDKLNGLSGADFDKEYCDMMVAGHKDAIDMFDKASRRLIDSDLQAWTANMLPQLRDHLDKAMDVQQQVDKTSARRN
jgi:putative membrane protein